MAFPAFSVILTMCSNEAATILVNALNNLHGAAKAVTFVWGVHNHGIECHDIVLFKSNILILAGEEYSNLCREQDFIDFEHGDVLESRHSKSFSASIAGLAS